MRLGKADPNSDTPECQHGPRRAPAAWGQRPRRAPDARPGGSSSAGRAARACEAQASHQKSIPFQALAVIVPTSPFQHRPIRPPKPAQIRHFRTRPADPIRRPGSAGTSSRGAWAKRQKFARRAIQSRPYGARSTPVRRQSIRPPAGLFPTEQRRNSYGTPNYLINQDIG
jgi:hypothetical protein